MPAGFQSYNDNNFVQIDDTDSFNLSLRSTGTVSLTNGYYEYMRFADIPLPGYELPFIALRAEPSWGINGLGIIGSYNVGGVNYVRACAVGTGVNWSLKYYIFDRPLVSAHGAGLEVYDSLGRIKYSSVTPAPKIVSVSGGQFDNSRAYAACVQCSVDYREQYDDSADFSAWSATFYGCSTGTPANPGLIEPMSQVVDQGSGRGRGGGLPFDSGLGYGYTNGVFGIFLDVTGL